MLRRTFKRPPQNWKKFKAPDSKQNFDLMTSVFLFLSIQDISNCANVCFLWFRASENKVIWTAYTNRIFEGQPLNRATALMYPSPSRLFVHNAIKNARQKMESLFAKNLNCLTATDWQSQMSSFRKALQQEKFVRAYQQKLISDKFFSDGYLFQFYTLSENMAGLARLLPHTAIVAKIFEGCAMDLLKAKIVDENGLLRACEALEYPQICHLFKNFKLAQLVYMSTNYFEIYKNIPAAHLEKIDEKSFKRIIENLQEGSSPKEAVALELGEHVSSGVSCPMM